jgi:hypothetical protein
LDILVLFSSLPVLALLAAGRAWTCGRQNACTQFADGLEGEVDMDHEIDSPGAGVFAQVADPDVFAAAFVEPTFGAVTWPGEIDLAPDAMYEEIKAHGRWVL